MARAGASRDGWRAAAARRVAVVLAVFAGGLVLVFLGDFTVGIIGWFIVGVALVGAVSVAFLEVGLSEDRDRER